MLKIRIYPHLKGNMKLKNILRTKIATLTEDGAAPSADAPVKRKMTEPMKQHAATFTRAVKAGKLVRRAFETFLAEVHDRTMHNRLMKVLMQCFKTDKSQPEDAHPYPNLGMLEKFTFNRRGGLSQQSSAGFNISINRQAGEVTLNIPSFVPSLYFSDPGRRTHYQFLCSVAELDFDTDGFETVDLTSGILPLNNQVATAIHHVQPIKAGSVLPFIAAFGIQFFGSSNNSRHPLGVCPRDIVLVDVDKPVKKQ